MTDVQIKYDHLLTRVEKLLRYQKEFLKFRASSDLGILKRMISEMDKIIERDRSVQKELF